MTYIPLITTTRLGTDAVTSAKILDGTVTSGDIADGTLVNADVNAAAAIAYSKLNLTGSIVSADIVDGTITGSDVASDTITAANLAANSVTASELADNAVDTNAILDDAVTAAKIGAGLDAIAAATASTGSITASSQKITNLADGTAATDAVNKGQLDAATLGLVDYKASVRLVSTTNLDLNGAETIDGVATAVGNRVLVTGQTAPAENGIYVVAAGAWTRATDADTSAEVTAGMYLAVEEGTTYADSLWLLTTNNPITLGTTGLTFVELPTLNDLVAGAGLTKTGSTIDVGAGNGITVNANDVAIDTAVVPRLGVANTFTANNTFAGVNMATATKTANYTADLAVDHTLLVDTTGGAVTITLPASHTAGDTLYVKDSGGVAGGANTITIDPADADTIDGAASYTFLVNYESVELRSNGTNWFIV